MTRVTKTNIIREALLAAGSAGMTRADIEALGCEAKGTIYELRLSGMPVVTRTIPGSGCLARFWASPEVAPYVERETYKSPPKRRTVMAWDMVIPLLRPEGISREEIVKAIGDWNARHGIAHLVNNEQLFSAREGSQKGRYIYFRTAAERDSMLRANKEAAKKRKRERQRKPDPQKRGPKFGTKRELPKSVAKRQAEPVVPSNPRNVKPKACPGYERVCDVQPATPMWSFGPIGTYIGEETWAARAYGHHQN